MKRWMLILLALALHAVAWAHKPSDSYLNLQVDDDDKIAIRWDIALRDLDYVLQLDRDGDGALTWGEVRQRAPDILHLATQRLALSSAGKACTLREAGRMQLDRHSDGTYAVLPLAAVCPKLEGSLKLRYSLLFDVDPTHRGLVQWRAAGAESAQALVFPADSAEQELQLEPAGPWRTLGQYIWEGMWHIWIGFDHILFLLALLLPSVLRRTEAGWQPVDSMRTATIDVVKVVTAFTLAHSITLSLAALQLITLPSRLVESVIAASVIVAALNNLWAKVEKRRWLMAFVFGLIHGFGFASVLADLGLPQGALLLALVGFNGGVELGQLAIVAVFLPVAWRLRATAFYRAGILQAGSLLVALLAAWWFVQRAFDL